MGQIPPPSKTFLGKSRCCIGAQALDCSSTHPLWQQKTSSIFGTFHLTTPTPIRITRILEAHTKHAHSSTSWWFPSQISLNYAGHGEVLARMALFQNMAVLKSSCPGQWGGFGGG